MAVDMNSSLLDQIPVLVEPSLADFVSLYLTSPDRSAQLSSVQTNPEWINALKFTLAADASGASVHILG